MAISIKSDTEIELMRHSCHLLAEVFLEMRDFIQPGISTKDIDRLGEKLIRKKGGVPNFLNYDGYPASICVSVNDEVVHGIPNKHRILKEGDIVSLDAGLIWKGYHSDMARTYGVGEVSKEAEQLMRVTKECFFKGMRFASAHHHLHEISNAIAQHAESYGYGIVRDLVGHGIGTSLHEEPQIPNFYQPKKRGPLLVKGMTLAVEPMINAGTWEVDWMDDGWTVRTKDRRLSAHYENTILITEGEPEILTLLKDEDILEI